MRRALVALLLGIAAAALLLEGTEGAPAPCEPTTFDFDAAKGSTGLAQLPVEVRARSDAGARTEWFLLSPNAPLSVDVAGDGAADAILTLATPRRADDSTAVDAILEVQDRSRGLLRGLSAVVYVPNRSALTPPLAGEMWATRYLGIRAGEEVAGSGPTFPPVLSVRISAESGCRDAFLEATVTASQPGTVVIVGGGHTGVPTAKEARATLPTGLVAQPFWIQSREDAARLDVVRDAAEATLGGSFDESVVATLRNGTSAHGAYVHVTWRAEGPMHLELASVSRAADGARSELRVASPRVPPAFGVFLNETARHGLSVAFRASDGIPLVAVHAAESSPASGSRTTDLRLTGVPPRVDALVEGEEVLVAAADAGGRPAKIDRAEFDARSSLLDAPEYPADGRVVLSRLTDPVGVKGNVTGIVRFRWAERGESEAERAFSSPYRDAVRKPKVAFATAPFFPPTSEYHNFTLVTDGLRSLELAYFEVGTSASVRLEGLPREMYLESDFRLRSRYHASAPLDLLAIALAKSDVAGAPPPSPCAGPDPAFPRQGDLTFLHAGVTVRRVPSDLRLVTDFSRGLHYEANAGTAIVHASGTFRAGERVLLFDVRAGNETAGIPAALDVATERCSASVRSDAPLSFLAVETYTSPPPNTAGQPAARDFRWMRLTVENVPKEVDATWKTDGSEAAATTSWRAGDPAFRTRLALSNVSRPALEQGVTDGALLVETPADRSVAVQMTNLERMTYKGTPKTVREVDDEDGTPELVTVDLTEASVYARLAPGDFVVRSRTEEDLVVARLRGHQGALRGTTDGRFFDVEARGATLALDGCIGRPVLPCPTHGATTLTASTGALPDLVHVLLDLANGHVNMGATSPMPIDLVATRHDGLSGPNSSRRIEIHVTKLGWDVDVRYPHAGYPLADQGDLRKIETNEVHLDVGSGAVSGTIAVSKDLVPSGPTSERSDFANAAHFYLDSLGVAKREDCTSLEHRTAFHGFFAKVDGLTDFDYEPGSASERTWMHWRFENDDPSRSLRVASYLAHGDDWGARDFDATAYEVPREGQISIRSRCKPSIADPDYVHVQLSEGLGRAIQRAAVLEPWKFQETVDAAPVALYLYINVPGGTYLDLAAKALPANLMMKHGTERGYTSVEGYGDTSGTRRIATCDEGYDLAESEIATSGGVLVLSHLVAYDVTRWGQIGDWTYARQNAKVAHLTLLPGAGGHALFESWTCTEDVSWRTEPSSTLAFRVRNGALNGRVDAFTVVGDATAERPRHPSHNRFYVGDSVVNIEYVATLKWHDFRGIVDYKGGMFYSDSQADDSCWFVHASALFFGVPWSYGSGDPPSFGDCE